MFLYVVNMLGNYWIGIPSFCKIQYCMQAGQHARLLHCIIASKQKTE